MELDDLIRPYEGIVVSLRDMNNGSSRLFFDDVVSNQSENPKSWEYRNFFTFSPEFKNTEIEAMNLSESQLADIGAAVVARLTATSGKV